MMYMECIYIKLQYNRICIFYNEMTYLQHIIMHLYKLHRQKNYGYDMTVEFCNIILYDCGMCTLIGTCVYCIIKKALCENIYLLVS